MEKIKILVTGGSGFIGSHFIRRELCYPSVEILNIDKLTYACCKETLRDVEDCPRYYFKKLDINDFDAVKQIFFDFNPDYVVNLAAESHVDRSIDSPEIFIKTNILGTYVLLEIVRDYLKKIPNHRRNNFKFLHVSTDEVFGDLSKNDPPFTEKSPYAPSSPYSASKASSDHLVRAWHRTYCLPLIISNCSNNYGPYQFPEKLIPLMILNALEGNPLPVYGKGDQIRDWLYVEDHVEALSLILRNGKIGETYNIGSNTEKTNLEVVRTICKILDKLHPIKLKNNSFEDLITHVLDRPGHDTRYAIDSTKLKKELGWSPRENFEAGIEKTIKWYLENQKWIEMTSKEYIGNRMGLTTF